MGKKNNKNRAAGSGTVSNKRKAAFKAKGAQREAMQKLLDKRSSLNEQQNMRDLLDQRSSPTEQQKEEHGYPAEVALEGFRGTQEVFNQIFDLSLDKRFRICERPTYWSQDNQFFLYYQAVYKRWALCLNDFNLLKHCKAGGTKGVAFQRSQTNDWFQFSQETLLWELHQPVSQEFLLPCEKVYEGKTPAP